MCFWTAQLSSTYVLVTLLLLCFAIFKRWAEFQFRPYGKESIFSLFITTLFLETAASLCPLLNITESKMTVLRFRLVHAIPSCPFSLHHLGVNNPLNAGELQLVPLHTLCLTVAFVRFKTCVLNYGEQVKLFIPLVDGGPLKAAVPCCFSASGCCQSLLE